MCSFFRAPASTVAMAGFRSTHPIAATRTSARFAAMESTRSCWGCNKVVSENSARRSFPGADEKASSGWLRERLQRTCEALLEEPCILGCRLQRINRFTGASRVPSAGTTRASRAALRTSTTLTLWLTCGWCWRWKYSRATRRRHRMRSRSCGSVSTAWRPSSGRRCCAAMSSSNCRF